MTETLSMLPTRRENPFDPPSALNTYRATDPVRPLRYPDGHVGWLVTSHALARQVLADPRFSARSEFKRVPVARPGIEPFYGRPAQPGWLVDMDPPEHTRMRQALAGFFTARRMTALRPRIEQIVRAYLDRMAQRTGPVDFVAEFALPVPSLTICELLGVPYSDREAFQHNSATLFSLDVSATAAAEAMAWLDAFMLDLVHHKRRHAGDDLLSMLADQATLRADEIAGAGVLLLTAGHETTASSLSLATFALLCHPEQLALLRDDPALADNAVEELLRYLTIFQFGVPRTPLQDVTLGEVVIKAGESVTISLPAANRDPAQFPDPDRLSVTRRTSGHVAFGFGVHQCLGQNLARIEMRVALPAVLRQFPGLRLAVDPADVPLLHDMGFYGVHRLPVAW